VREVRNQLHTNIGVDFYLNSMIHMLENGNYPKRPWVGVLHATPDQHVRTLISESIYMEKCVGIFGLSGYVCDFLKSITDKKVSRIHLAVGRPAHPFNPDKFLSNQSPKILMIGHWMRRFESIYQLVAKGYKKTILMCKAPEAPDYENFSIKFQKNDQVYLEKSLAKSDYEKIFEDNLVFLDLLDSSANNSVIECMVNRTPLLINRLPALEEHLGSSYPLFFDSIDEASCKINDKNLILYAHEHMKSINIDKYLLENFARYLSESDVYKSLPKVKI
jgi:hypothetical protein